MQAAVQIGGIAMVGVLSIALALLVDWLSLWALMRLLRRRQPALVLEQDVPLRARRFRPRAAAR
jgi:hypothetical protein